MDYEKEVARLHLDQRNLQSDLETARQEARKLKVDFPTVQSALAALTREVANDKERLSIGIGDFKRWIRQSSVNADTLISDSDRSMFSSDTHHVFAHNALRKVRSEDWISAYEDANKVIFILISMYLCPLIHTSSLSSLGRLPWVILPRL